METLLVPRYEKSEGQNSRPLRDSIASTVAGPLTRPTVLGWLQRKGSSSRQERRSRGSRQSDPWRCSRWCPSFRGEGGTQHAVLAP